MSIIETIEDLIYELNMAIDEVNTMRDLHHKDNLTPEDHWDKDTLHNSQIALRDFVENGATKLSDRIETHYNSNVSAFARTQDVRQDQVARWLKRNCYVIDGVVCCEVSKAKLK